MNMMISYQELVRTFPNFLNITTSIKLFTRTSGPCRSLFIVIRDDDKNKAALF
jgi:hypothetical protein